MNSILAYERRASFQLARYLPVMFILALAIMSSVVARQGLHLPMYGMEYDPPLSAILFHIFSHNDAAHFLGNYLGLFFYAALFCYACHKEDFRAGNRLMALSLGATIAVSILLALFVVPNDNGVTGISGVVNFLMGYFWVGVAPMLLIRAMQIRKLRLGVGLYRTIRRSPFLIAFGFLFGTIVAHWIIDGFAGLNPLGENPIGNFYHLVGYLGGCGAGLDLVKGMSGREGASRQRLALRQSHGI